MGTTKEDFNPFIILMSENNELSERELDILRLVATGASNKEIAQELYISSNTVKVHLRNIFAKIDVASRTEAAMYAVQHGYVDAPRQDGDDSESVVDSGAKGNVGVQKYRFQPLALWSVVVTVILLGFAGVLFVVLILYPENSPVSQSPTQELRDWEILASMPTARYGFASAVYENWIYAIAGENGDGVVANNERYNPELDSWEILQDKPVPVVDVSSDVIGGKIYVPGGRLDSGAVTNILEVFDIQQGKWDTKTSIPKPLSAYASIAYEGRLYIFGGWDGEQFVDTVYEYNPDEDHWIEKTPMSEPRGYLSAILIEDSIHLLGGKNDQEILTLHEVYAPNLDNGLGEAWSMDLPLPVARHSFSAASVAGLIYILGGVGGDETESPESLVLLSVTREWQVLPSPNQKGVWAFPGLQFWGNNLYLFGGSDGQQAIGDMNSYQVISVTILPIIQQ